MIKLINCLVGITMLETNTANYDRFIYIMSNEDLMDLM